METDVSSFAEKLLGEKLSVMIGKGLDKVIDNIEFVMNNNILEYLVEESNRNVNIKTLLHRATPVNLFSIYQPLFIKPSRYWQAEDIKDEKIATDSILKLFKNHQYITLRGTAGSGKSTIVKYLFINAIQTKFKIPIKVELRYLNDYEFNMIKFIQDKIFKFQKLSNSDQIIEKLMQSGNFVFFLDGYDEINSIKKEKITKEIDDLVKRYNKNNYMLTSRPFTDIEMLPLFTNYDVCKLSSGDIDEFIRKQIPKEEEELTGKIIESVHNQENSNYRSFLSNPLLLSMFILTFQSYSNIPQNRSDFYKQVFETLYSLHDSISKMAFVREKQCGLSKENIVEVLKLFSFLSYFDGKFTFSLQYLEEKLDLIKTNKRNISFENQKLIQDLQIAIGIITREGTEYSYPHRSLQEYFAALYISSLSESNKEKIYSKIYSSCTKEKGIAKREYDNFYSLLSELDKRATIKYVIIPLLSNAIDFINAIENRKYKEIINIFVMLRNTYLSFDNVLSNKRTFVHEEITYDKYFVNELHDIKFTGSEKGKKAWHESMIEKVRMNLTQLYIIPFLKGFVKDIQQTQSNLEQSLIDEDAIDEGFINLA